MRHITPSESLVMQEFERIAAASGWMPQKKEASIEELPKVDESKKPESFTSVVEELVSLANDLDEMGKPKTAEAIDEQLRLYKTAVEKLYDITGETGEQLINEAHPGGGPTMVPAKDEGGKFETIVEQQKKDIKVVETKPTGKQADFIVRQLVALANRLDEEGKTEAALLVDKTLAEMREGSARPFVGNLQKEAIPIVAPLILWGLKLAIVGAAGATLVKLLRYFSSMVGKVWDDSRDLIVSSQALLSKDPTNKELRQAVEELKEILIPVSTELKNAKDALEQSNSDQNAQKFVVAISNFDNAMPLIQSTVSKIVKLGPYFSPLAFMQKQYIEEHLSDLLKGFSTLKENSARISEQVAARKNVKAPEAAKEELPYEKQLRDAMLASHNKLLGTADTLLGGLAKSIQNTATEAEADRLLRGKLSEVIDWLKKLRQIKEPASLAEKKVIDKLNDRLWNGYLMPLRRSKLKNLFASKNVNIKTALTIPEAPTGPLGEPAKTKAPVRPMGKGLGNRKRDDILQLQQIMSQLSSFPPGIPGPIDGIWGKKTREGWETLRSMTGKALVQAPPPNVAPQPNEVARAIRVAEWLQSHLSKSNNIPIAGVEIPLMALQNPQLFLKWLEKAGKITKGETGSLNTAANRKLATDALRDFAENAESDVNIATRFDANQLRDILYRVNTLATEFERATELPSYSLPAGTQPSGQIGNMGTIEGRTGKSIQQAPKKPEMSLDGKVYNLLDVSNFVNNPAQFADFAKRLLKKSENYDPYVAALDLVADLRKQISNLYIETTRLPDKNTREALQNTLRQRHEALNEMYQALPKH